MAGTYFATSRFAGNGSTTIFTFAFDGGYIDKAHVKAYIENDTTKARSAVTVTTAMFTADFTVNLAVSAPVGSTMVIYRDTPKNLPLVDFVTGSRITEANLDKATQQAVFGIAEIYDQSGVDAVASTTASAGAAKTSETNAATSATNAATSAAAAAASTTTAAGSATTAGTHATNAAASATAAAASQTAAATSATNAATSETNALTSKNAAATSATNAATSESNALTSKNNAATSATNAATSESNALTSKNAAATSATNAAASATSAAGFSPKAWVNFRWDGAAVVVNASAGVTSVVRNAGGQYTVTFSTAMADTGYAAVATASSLADNNATNNLVVGVMTKATGSCKLFVGDNNTDAAADPADCSAVFYR